MRAAVTLVTVILMGCAAPPYPKLPPLPQAPARDPSCAAVVITGQRVSRLHSGHRSCRSARGWVVRPGDSIDDVVRGHPHPERQMLVVWALHPECFPAGLALSVLKVGCQIAKQMQALQVGDKQVRAWQQQLTGAHSQRARERVRRRVLRALGWR